MKNIRVLNTGGGITYWGRPQDGPLEIMSEETSGAMIGPAFVCAMAAYNAQMNRRIYAAAGRLPDIVRHWNAGAFWKSIHGTLSHLVWADETWLSRFTGSKKPDVPLKDSGSYIRDFKRLEAIRTELDAAIVDWAKRVERPWLDEQQVWFSGAANREMRLPRSVLIAHFFNHQTHHRGQAHAMLTAMGEQTGDTDLFLLI
jgi:uncharacterized damage-inducible protein DinB